MILIGLGVNQMENPIRNPVTNPFNRTTSCHIIAT